MDELGDKLRIGLIGYGYWGPNLARNINAMHRQDVQLAAVADHEPTNRLRASDAYPHVAVLDDGEELIASPDIDAVVIATPVASHFDLVRSAISNGKHVLVEKPLAATVSEATQLADMATEQHSVLMVGHVFEYTSAVNHVKEAIGSGYLGEILYVRSLRVNLGVYQSDINVLWDLAPHDVSILNYVLGEEPTSVSSVGQAHVTEDVVDIVNLNLRYGQKTLATVVVSWLDPRKIREMTIIGSKKMLVYDDVSATEKIRIYDKGVEGPAHYESFGEFHYSYRYGDIVSPLLEHREPLAEECQHFVDCIRHGKQPRSGPVSGVRVVRTLAAAQASLDSAGAVIPLDDPRVLTASGRVGDNGKGTSAA